jgi:electron transport complex protein RnfC
MPASKVTRDYFKSDYPRINRKFNREHYKMETQAVKTFPGGVHPPESKQYSQGRPIEIVPVPEQVTVLLCQHLGAPCKPIVNKKDAVRAGQKIGASDAFVSAAVHSPVNGTIKDIVLAPHPVLGRTMGVVIETDPQSEPQKPCADKFSAGFNPETWTTGQICQSIHEAGLVGMGGAGFPTRVKIEPNPSMPKEILVVNGCECEPFLTCDYRIMLEWTWQILAGIRLAAKASDVEKIRIGIEDNKPEAIEVFRQAIQSCKDLDIQVVPVKTKYPQGGERQLIQAVLNKTVPTNSIPPVIGAAVINVATAAAIAEAVVLGQPLTHRVVSVTGRAIAKPGNYYCPVGMSVQDVVNHCGGLNESAAKVVMGGPMMGFAIADLSTPLTKTSGGLTFLTRQEVTEAKFKRQETTCIRCGRCITACPENLNPTRIAHAVKHNKLDLAQQHFMSGCIECGCCSYVCPAHIELTGYIKTGKLLVARAKKKA